MSGSALFISSFSNSLGDFVAGPEQGFPLRVVLNFQLRWRLALTTAVVLLGPVDLGHHFLLSHRNNRPARALC